MTRSRLRKIRHIQSLARSRVLRTALPFASAVLALVPTAQAQQATDDSTATLEEIVVTAEKRTENLQDVPVSIQALSTAKLEELHVTDFTDYAQFMPTVSFQSDGPGFSHAYMRGVAANNNINHSGPSPSVGVYLDEQPITTIDGELDLHIYDIERVEALAGPQGTLYGASSQSGTIRIITNKPDPSKFSAGYDAGVDTVDHGGVGYVAEGFVNMPITSFAAVRLVGWDEKKAGYINNIDATITWPTSGIVENNDALAKKNYNDVETKGTRGALKIDIGDNWTITPAAMGQIQDSHGVFGFNPALGDLNVEHFLPEGQHDSWVQSALTIEGKLSNLDIVYAGGILNRNTHTTSDYTDYSYFYDNTYGSGTYYRDNAGNLINPDQEIIGRDNYKKISQEIRISTPKEYAWRFVGGGFYQRQVHEILQDYIIQGLADMTSVAQESEIVTGWPNTWWLTDQERVDQDQAVFGELSYDITQQLTATVGDRHFWSQNGLVGFYGFGETSPFGADEGEQTCIIEVPFHGAPCQDLNGHTKASGDSPKVNLTFKIDDQRMIYATFSKGFRPGGVNRAGGGDLPPYKPDYLTNYELGWKTTWLANSLRFNGAVFREDWKNFQFSFLGPNSLTIIQNAGQAQIIGGETDMEWAASKNLTISGGLTVLSAELKQNYCGEAYCPAPEAPYGTQLPVTPKAKADLTARYVFDLAGGQGYFQAAGAYVGQRWADLRSAEYKDTSATTATYLGNPRGILGSEAAYATFDVSMGLDKNGFNYEIYINNLTDERAQLDRYVECDAVKCGLNSTYILPSQPRTIGIKFGEKF